MSYDQLTKAQQDTLLADFMEGKTTICEAGHVDWLERIIADLREENKRLRAELADIPYRAVATK